MKVVEGLDTFMLARLPHVPLLLPTLARYGTGLEINGSLDSQ
jgi:hypothetical protein